MTLLVRDEQDIIRENIEFHLAQGVDFFIVTDNKSVDSTKDILIEYEDQGKLHYIYEGDDDYNQHTWVTKMARMAYTEFAADWVINSDADEFWWPKKGDLKETVVSIPAKLNLFTAQRINFVPVETTGLPFYSAMVYREKVSLNPQGKLLPKKIAHRGNPEINVAQGNHKLEGVRKPKTKDGLVDILHFPIRTYGQFTNKIAKGGAAYERNVELREKVGAAWRELYKEYKVNDGLGDYYKKHLYDESKLQESIANGTILEDRRLHEFLSVCMDEKSG